MKVGVLTGGGDCPGLNAVIRAVVRKGESFHGDEFVGYADGWRGVVEGLTLPLDSERCRGILPRGGTILGTSRVSPQQVAGGVEAALRNLAAVDALVVIGGEGTLGGGSTPVPGKPGPARRPCRRRSTTTSALPRSRSASTPPSRSRPMRSTGFTRPQRLTTGSWSAR